MDAAEEASRPGTQRGQKVSTTRPGHLPYPGDKWKMIVLHLHWKMPESEREDGAALFWGESTSSKPKRYRGKLSPDARPREHPYTAWKGEMPALLSSDGYPWDEAVLLLPSTSTGPVLSPELPRVWAGLDETSPPAMSRWRVGGVLVPPWKTFSVLLDLPDKTDEFVLGDDVKFWRLVALLALEILAKQKFVPNLSVEDGQFVARWKPVLDTPEDAQRLRILDDVMPPLCRSGAPDVPPRRIVASFLNAFVDGAIRRWMLGRMPTHRGEKELGDEWLLALSRVSPVLGVTKVQGQSLLTSHRAWVRNLHYAGNEAFRIAFRLAPEGSGKRWKVDFLLQARDDPSLVVPAADVWKSRGKGSKVLKRRLRHPREFLLTGLGYASRIYPPLAQSLKSSNPTGMFISADEVYRFLREDAPLLESSGFGILVPPWWNKPSARLGLRATLSAPGSEGVGAGIVSLENLVNVRWEVVLGDVTLSREEFENLVSLKMPIVQVRGQWVRLDPEQVEAAIRFWEKQRQQEEVGLLEATRIALGAEGMERDGLRVEDVEVEGRLKTLLDRLKESHRMKILPPPQGLRASLRPYQKIGYSWLAFLSQIGMGACLADDMGLGKTVQALAVIQREKEQHGELPAPSLVVCPTSVVPNWGHEAKKFAPDLKVMLHQGPNRFQGERFVEEAGKVDLVVTSYALVRRDIEFIGKVRWDIVILDEAQNIKNPMAQQSRAVRSLRSDFRVALTGTPVENRLSELWSIMNFLNPGYLGAYRSFRREFATRIERYRDREATERLRKLISPFIMRRVKTDPRVIQDLPDKIEKLEYAYLTEEQATLYQAVVEHAIRSIEESDGIQRRGLVLSMLTQLKQICNHPAQYLHQKPSPKELAALPERSGKMKRLLDLLEVVQERGEKALIFTQYREMGEILWMYLQRHLWGGALFLDGGTPSKKREEMIHRFQEDPNSPPVFILSLKAGGTGLNLTAASHVFHFDRWWNPAVEDQATDRTYRIGQKKNVLVHKFVTTGTLEERIDELIQAKKALAQAVMGGGETWLTELSTDELRELVRLRI